MPEDPATKPPPESAELDLLMPLHFFLGGGAALDVTFMAGREIPEPYRGLLVHDSDMTPALAEFYGSDIGLRVHQQTASDDFIMRAVVLDREAGDGRREPVEYGAIGIQLESFSEAVRHRIREGEYPLGAILQQEEVVHSSRPRGYFRIAVSVELEELLQAPAGSLLYGRSNVLSDAEGIDFADIVEILPLVGEQ